MSTTPNPLPGQQITGVDSKDLETLIQQRVSEEYAKLTAAQKGVQEIPPASPGPVKLSVYGKDLEFENPEAASKAIEAALAQVRQEAQAEAGQQTPQAPQTPAQTPQNGFSNEKFAEYVQENPLKGLEYALGHMVFGQDVPGAGKLIRQELEQQRQMRQVLAAYQFSSANPQFQGGPQEVQVIEKARQFLGLAPDNPESWQAAYAYAVSKGALPPPQPQTPAQNPARPIQQTPYSQGYAAPAQPGPMTPPSLGRSAPVSSNWMEQAEAMSPDQLEALIKKISSGG